MHVAKIFVADAYVPRVIGVFRCPSHQVFADCQAALVVAERIVRVPQVLQRNAEIVKTTD